MPCFIFYPFLYRPTVQHISGIAPSGHFDSEKASKKERQPKLRPPKVTRYPVPAAHPVHEERACRFSSAAVHIPSANILSGHLQIENHPLPSLQWRHITLPTIEAVPVFYRYPPCISTGFPNSRQAGHPCFRKALLKDLIPSPLFSPRQVPPLLFPSDGKAPFPPCPQHRPRSVSWHQ